MRPHCFDRGEARRLYDAGQNDSQIARRFGVDHSAISQWRRKAGLPSHYSRKPAERPDYAAQYALGKCDREIMAATGGSRPSVRRWRAKLGLRANRDPARTGGRGLWLAQDADAERLALYQQGLPDEWIAAIVGAHGQTIRDWRKRRGLPTMDARGAQLGIAPLKRKRKPVPAPLNPITQLALWRRIDAAIPRWPAPDIRADVASEMLLAVVSGELPEAGIEAAAKRYTNQTVNQFASRWGPLSMDEVRQQHGNEFTLHQLLDDPAQLSAMRCVELQALADVLARCPEVANG